jgi:6-pyruvoyl-tetrahydropterin synthase
MSGIRVFGAMRERPWRGAARSFHHTCLRALAHGHKYEIAFLIESLKYDIKADIKDIKTEIKADIKCLRVKCEW